MCSPEELGSSVSVRRLNAELEQAQLELLSAHCATHQLRLHYSTSDLVRFGRRDVLRRSAEAASALNEFYESIEKNVPRLERHPRRRSLRPSGSGRPSDGWPTTCGSSATTIFRSREVSARSTWR
jgi:hypothetical protein